jgi:predicted RNA-binding protein with PIN domain
MIFTMATEHVIIDGYNVVFRIPRLRELAGRSLEAARDELLRWVEESHRGRRERVTLVFDGERDPVHGGRTRRGEVRVVFSEPPESADDVIRRLVEAERRRGSRTRLACRVVTSDAAVARHARLSGGKSVGVESFVRGLGVPSARVAGERDEDGAAGRGTGGGGSTRGGRTGRAPTTSGGSSGGVTGDETKPRVGRRELDEMEQLFRRRNAPDDDDDQEV